MVKEFSSCDRSPFTIGVVSTPAPQHLSIKPPSYGTNLHSVTFTTTPQKEIEYTLSQISPGHMYSFPKAPDPHTEPPSGSMLSLSSLDPYGPSPGFAIKNTRYESVYPRYSTGFNWRKNVSTYNNTPNATSPDLKGPSSSGNATSSNIFTITRPEKQQTSFCNNVSTATPSYSEILRTKASVSKTESPKWQMRVELDPSEGYDNLHFELEDTKGGGGLGHTYGEGSFLQVPKTSDDISELDGRGE